MRLPAHKGRKQLLAILAVCLLVWMGTRFLSRPVLPPPAAAPIPLAALTISEGIHWHDGVPFSGVAADYFPNGQMRQRSRFQDGRLTGSEEEWWENGRPRRTTDYRLGRRHGQNTCWNSDGSLQLSETWADDTPTSSIPSSR